MSPRAYENYELVYQNLFSKRQDFIPSFSLIEFYKKSLSSFLLEQTHLKILELGVGGGTFFSSLDLSIPVDITAIDISKTAIENARKAYHPTHLKIRYDALDACRLSLGEEFDLVMDAHCLHTITSKEHRESFFKGAFNHAKNEGLFAFETMVHSKKMDFEEGFFYSEEEQTLFKEINDEKFSSLRTFYGKRYMPVRSIKRAHEIEEEVFKAGFQIKYFQILSGYKVIYDERRLSPLPTDPDLLRVIAKKIL